MVYRKEKLEHTTSYVISHFQFDGTNIRWIVYRILTKPYQPGRNWGFLEIGSYGYDSSITARFEKYQNWPFPWVDEYYTIPLSKDIKVKNLLEIV